MKQNVVRQTGKRTSDEFFRCPESQPFRFPDDLFGMTGTREEDWYWICARTRPRWEKKLAHWLHQRRQRYFLPVFRRETRSGRKRRISELPLFPGFVFVAGDCSKAELSATGCVAYVLRPRGQTETKQLHRELCGIWSGLTSGLYVTPVQNLAAGETCRIVEGPLKGQKARFERLGRQGRVMLQVEMMGGGIAVELPLDEVAPCE